MKEKDTQASGITGGDRDEPRLILSLGQVPPGTEKKLDIHSPEKPAALSRGQGPIRDWLSTRELVDLPGVGTVPSPYAVPVDESGTDPTLTSLSGEVDRALAALTPTELDALAARFGLDGRSAPLATEGGQLTARMEMVERIRAKTYRVGFERVSVASRGAPDGWPCGMEPLVVCDEPVTGGDVWQWRGAFWHSGCLLVAIGVSLAGLATVLHRDRSGVGLADLLALELIRGAR
jgi:hypothetical protein